MAEDDFGIESLAGYLHLDAAQVVKLVERGKLPGRRVAGQWRFSRPEIHHWLEERIGLSTDAELVQMEGALDRAATGDEAIDLLELMPSEAIAVPLEARTRSSVITSIVDVAARTGWLWDTAKMAEAVRAREDMLATALDNGVALLHPRRPLPNLLAQPLVAFGRTSRGIPFGGPRGILTDLFFLILSVDDSGHLRVLARLSRALTDPAFLDELRAAPDATAVRLAVAARQERLI